MAISQLFLLILVFLMVLAVFDLFVGVSNDAVNFLNSAVGSRVAPFKVVMLVASAGVLIGATFSSGMMEIARSMKEVARRLRMLLEMAASHLDNRHSVYRGALRENLLRTRQALEEIRGPLRDYTRSRSVNGVELSDCADHCLARVNAIQSDLLLRIDEERLSLRGSELYLTFLQFVREAINRYTTIAFLQREMDKDAAS